MEQKEIEKLQEKVRDRMTEKRFLHTVGVRYTACMLAMKYNVDLDRASIAGVLHDCAKCLSDERMLKECSDAHIPVSELEARNPHLLHGKLGAYYAQTRYDIEDEEILSAIRCHTIGKPNMTTLEEILFVADYIEPHRKPLTILPQIRQTAFTDLREAVYLIMKATLDYLTEVTTDGKGRLREIDPGTREAFAYYEQLHQHKEDI